MHFAEQHGSTLWLLTEASYINDEIRGDHLYTKLQVVDGDKE